MTAGFPRQTRWRCSARGALRNRGESARGRNQVPCRASSGSGYPSSAQMRRRYEPVFWRPGVCHCLLRVLGRRQAAVPARRQQGSILQNFHRRVPDYLASVGKRFKRISTRGTSRCSRTPEVGLLGLSGADLPAALGLGGYASAHVVLDRRGHGRPDGRSRRRLPFCQRRNRHFDNRPSRQVDARWIFSSSPTTPKC